MPKQFLKMKVRKCSVIECSSVKRNPKISFFSLPKTNSLAWNEAISNANGKETIVKFVCAEHFLPDDILTTYSCPSDVADIIGNRIKNGLKKGAVPSVFHCEEKISEDQRLRTTVSSAAKHLPNHNYDHNYAKYQNEQSHERVLFKENILQSVQILSFNDLSIHLKRIVLPKGWATYLNDNEIAFYKPNFMLNKMDIEKQLVFKSTLEIRMFIYQHCVNVEKINSKLEYPLHSNYISQAIQILNYKNVCQGGPSVLNFPGIHVRTAKLENYGIWRHNNCPILLDLKKKCQSCKQLYKYFNRKQKLESIN